MKENKSALSPWEYDRVKRLLARVPNDLELRIITALWSEQCSYKSTKAYLSTLPTSAHLLAVGPAQRCEIVELDDLNALIINVDASDHEAHMCEQVRAGLMREHSAMGGDTIALIEQVVPGEQINMLALGLVKKKAIPSAKASGVKNRVLYVGADLEQADYLVSKKIKQACQSCIKEDLVVGLSPIGIAGLALTLFAMASRASTGLLINLEEASSFYAQDNTLQEILLSEKPERMLMVAEPTKVLRIKQIFSDHGLSCNDIGRVCGDGFIRVTHAGQEVASLGATLILENAPRYRHQYQSVVPKAFGPSLASQAKITLSEVLATSKSLRESTRPLFLNLDKSQKNIILSFLTYSKLLRTNSLEAARRGVYLGALEVNIKGASPQALALCFSTQGLQEEAFMTQFKHTIDGIAHAAHALSIPVMAAHVKINRQAMPLLALGVIGMGENLREPAFNMQEEEQLLVLLGELPTDYTGAESIFGARLEDPPLRAWEFESIKILSEVTRAWAKHHENYFAFVLGAGGLLRGLEELMSITHRGLRLEFGAEWLSDDLPLGLLSEDSPRVLLCLSKTKLPSLVSFCAQKVPLHIIGRLASDNFSIYHKTNLVYKRSI